MAGRRGRGRAVVVADDPVAEDPGADGGHTDASRTTPSTTATRPRADRRRTPASMWAGRPALLMARRNS